MSTNLSYDVMFPDINPYNNSTGNGTQPEVENYEAELAMTRFVVQKVLVPIVTSIGLFGNIISICVLTNRAMLSSTNCYLTALAIFDLLYVVFSFTLSLDHYETIKTRTMFRLWFGYCRCLTDICSNVSVCLTVTFSLERLVAVCYPMRGRAICTPQRARLITCGVVMFAVCCTVPEFFEERWGPVVNDNNITSYEFVPTEMVKTDVYIIGYYNFIVFTFTALPIILLSTFNGLLVRAVISAMNIRKQMAYTSITQDRNRRQKEQNRITIMLIGVVIVFLLCQFPNAAVLMYYTFAPAKMIKETRNKTLIAGNIVNLLVLINSSTNFILYSAMSTKFRKVCLSIFCICDKRKKDTFTKTESSLDNNGHIPLHFRSRKFTHLVNNGGHSNIYTTQNRRIVRFSDTQPIPSRNIIHSKQTAPFVTWDNKNIDNNENSADCHGEDDEYPPMGNRRPNNRLHQNGVSVGPRIICSTGGQTPSRDVSDKGTTDLLEIQFFIQNEALLMKRESIDDTIL